MSKEKRPEWQTKPFNFSSLDVAGFHLSEGWNSSGADESGHAFSITLRTNSKIFTSRGEAQEAAEQALIARCKKVIELLEGNSHE